MSIPIQTHSFSSRVDLHMKRRNASFTDDSRIMRPVGVALCGVAIIFAKIALNSALSFNANLLAGTAILVIALGGIYSLARQSYADIQLRPLIAREQALEKEIQDEKLNWQQAKELNDERNLFSSEELNSIVFGSTSLDYLNYTATHPIAFASEPIRNQLCGSFSKMIANEKIGYLALITKYKLDITELKVDLAFVWDSIKAHEFTLPVDEFITRNGDVTPFLNAQERENLKEKFLERAEAKFDNVLRLELFLNAAKSLCVTSELEQVLNQSGSCNQLMKGFVRNFDFEDGTERFNLLLNLIPVTSRDIIQSAFDHLREADERFAEEKKGLTLKQREANNKIQQHENESDKAFEERKTAARRDITQSTLNDNFALTAAHSRNRDSILSQVYQQLAAL